MNQRERIEEYEALGAPKNRGQRLAELEKELKQAQTELTGLTDTLEGLTARKQVVGQRVRAIQNQLEQMKPRDLQISDHVVLRYMEREHGIDVEGVREMLKEMLKGAANLGDLKVQGFVIRGNTVVTYVPPRKG